MLRWQSLKLLVPFVVLLALVIGVPQAQANMITNSGVESQVPFFWAHGDMGGTLTWASDDAHNGSRSLKITKNSTGSAASWETYNQANTYWNSMAATLYTFTFWAKTSGVNTSPASDDAKIGAKWVFLDDAGNNIIDPVYTWVDQSAATSDWTEYSAEIALPSAPAEAYCSVVMMSGATGTAWFDQFNIASDPWTAGFFGDDVETPSGWLHWTDGTNGFADAVMTDQAHDGDYAVKLEENDDGSDEMVFYSTPVPAEPNTKYLVGVWVKIDAASPTSDLYYPTQAIGANVAERANLCFFFHRGDIYNGWDVTGGDQFVYFNQTEGATEDGWRMYWAEVTSPEDASGISMRARFNSLVQGTVYYDDFFCYKLDEGENIVDNGDFETNTPAFWNQGSTGGTLTWATDEANNGSHSLKIDKTGTGTAASWVSANQANTYWNAMAATLYNFSFYAKTSGVNTSPVSDAAKIGAKWTFLDADGNNVIDPVYTWVDQSSASVDWTEYTAEIALPAAPATATCEVMMGSDATGTVWFDQFNLSSDPWTAGFFGDDVETQANWLHWTDGTNGFADVVDVGGDAHSGTHVCKLLEADDGGDEMVYYSVPFALDANEYYEFSVWVKETGMSPVNDMYYPSHVIGDNFADRANLCFFFHRGDIVNGWDVTGGDQFVYFQQVDATTDGWVKYTGVAKAPEDATGASIRARFNSTVQGEVWYDDFEIRQVTLTDPDVAVDPGVNVDAALPSSIVLDQNYPNPFNAMTNISYALPTAGKVTLTVYDLLGREVARLVDGQVSAGRHTVSFKSHDLSSGVYFYRLKTENGSVVRKMMYLK